MDTESLKSLGWLLLWGGFFYLMMRHGCGAHMMGGHGHHGTDGAGDATSEDANKDPVCGMAVDSKKSTAASAYRGKTYRFCSATCRDKFEKEPAKYAGAADSEVHPQGGHHHG